MKPQVLFGKNLAWCAENAVFPGKNWPTWREIHANYVGRVERGEIAILNLKSWILARAESKAGGIV